MDPPIPAFRKNLDTANAAAHSQNAKSTANGSKMPPQQVCPQSVEALASLPAHNRNDDDGEHPSPGARKIISTPPRKKQRTIHFEGNLHNRLGVEESTSQDDFDSVYVDNVDSETIGLIAAIDDHHWNFSPPKNKVEQRITSGTPAQYAERNPVKSLVRYFVPIPGFTGFPSDNEINRMMGSLKATGFSEQFVDNLKKSRSTLYAVVRCHNHLKCMDKNHIPLIESIFNQPIENLPPRAQKHAWSNSSSGKCILDLMHGNFKFTFEELLPIGTNYGLVGIVDFSIFQKKLKAKDCSKAEVFNRFSQLQQTPG